MLARAALRVGPACPSFTCLRLLWWQPQLMLLGDRVVLSIVAALLILLPALLLWRKRWAEFCGTQDHAVQMDLADVRAHVARATAGDNVGGGVAVGAVASGSEEPPQSTAAGRGTSVDHPDGTSEGSGNDEGIDDVRAPLVVAV